MIDSIRAKLVSVLSDAVDVYQSEAETDAYPYVVYDVTSSPVLDKDGVRGFVGDTKVRIVGVEFDVIDNLRAQVESAILSGMHDDTFFSKLNTTDKECVDGVWTIELSYTLKQYADWAQPVEQTTE